VPNIPSYDGPKRFRAPALATPVPSRDAWRLGLAFATVYLVWGSTYLAIRYAVETLPPLLMAGSRHLVAGLALYAFARRRSPEAPTRLHWRSAAIIGTLLLLGGNGGVSWAEQRVPSGLTALIVATVPLWMVLLHTLREGRQGAGLRTGIGILVGLAGVGVLVDPRAGDRVDPLGALVLVFAALSWATGSLYARRAPLPAAPLLATAMELLAGGAALVVAGLVLGEAPRVDLAAASARSLLSWGYLVVFGSIVGFTAYIYLLNHAAPAAVSTYAYVNPVVAVVLGWAFADEALSARTAVAGAVILAAVVLLTLRPATKPRAPAASVPAEPT
jgi:drug/metabolite transporter (DMT)-like permease